MNRVFLPVLAWVLLAASGCSGENVLHGKTSAEAVESDRTVWAFFDRGGDLYSAPALPVELDDRTLPGPDTLFLRNNYLRLGADSPWGEVQRGLGLRPDASWESVQGALSDRIGEQVDRLTARPGQPRRPLVILVHGYNVEDARSEYRPVRASLAPHLPDAVFLQVGWDGLTATNPLSVWEEAQYNFPQVGYGLRKLLLKVAAVDASIPIRIFTHSSGGPVAAHALWDASASISPRCEEPAEPGREEYHARHCSETRPDGSERPGPAPPRFEDVRIGMIVPATNAWVVRNYDPAESHVDRVVIGVNPEDEAVTRLGMRLFLKPFTVSCKLWGDTCLPVRKDYACGESMREFREKGFEVEVFDFSGSRSNRRRLARDIHAWEVYLGRDDHQRFVRAVLDPEVRSSETAAYCRGEPLGTLR